VADTKTKNKSITMADLMKSAKASFVSLKKGEVIEGIITKLTPQEILVDIGSKTEAVVLEKDRKILKNLLSSLKVGDKVSVSVLNPESDMGNTVVSLRKFIGDKVWDRLSELYKNKKAIKINVNDSTKGGFLVSSDNGISGFLPNSQVSFAETGQELVGKTLDVLILELSRINQKVIFSNKAISGSDNFDKAIKKLRIDQKISSSISNITPFGIFTSFASEDGNVEGFIHISEISWDKISQIPQNFKPGDKIEAMIIGFDKKSSRINLSLKRLVKDPLTEKLEQFTTDKKVSGKVIKVLTTGVLVDLGDEIEGLIKKEKIPPTITYSVGSSIAATVSEVDKKKHRIILIPVLKEKPIGYR